MGRLWLQRERVKAWLPVLALSSGVGSFVLVDRQASLAGWIAAFMLLSWALLLAAPYLGQVFTKLTGRAFPPVIGHFALQFVHQESFYFVLPFFFFATTWTSGQAFFTGALALAGVVAIWDPWYFKLAKIRWLYMLYHGLSVFVVTLTALPIIFELTTGQSYALAVAFVAIVSVLSFPQLRKMAPVDQRYSRYVPLVLVPIIIAAAWGVRSWVPPATLRLNRIAITDHIDAEKKVPSSRLVSVSDHMLHERGLYAYTAIRAPRGLRETIYHTWTQDGRIVDRIPMKISGGREAGYRAWTHKRGFPANAKGDWEVRVETSAGQLIGVLDFMVD